MDDQFMLEAMHPTAGYLFAEELDVHFMDLHSTLLLEDFRSAADCSFSFGGGCNAPSSPSSVALLPLFHPPPPLKLTPLDEADIFIKLEPVPVSVGAEHSFLTPVPVVHVGPVTNERERLRCRQRGYEKRYRGRKRVSSAFHCRLKPNYNNTNQP